MLPDGERAISKIETNKKEAKIFSLFFVYSLVRLLLFFRYLQF